MFIPVALMLAENIIVHHKKIVSDYQFKQPIPVNIYYITTKKGLNVAKVAGNILLTPFTLAFDAAGGIFLLPIYFDMENWN